MEKKKHQKLELVRKTSRLLNDQIEGYIKWKGNIQTIIRNNAMEWKRKQMRRDFVRNKVKWTKSREEQKR